MLDRPQELERCRPPDIVPAKEGPQGPLGLFSRFLNAVSRDQHRYRGENVPPSLSRPEDTASSAPSAATTSWRLRFPTNDFPAQKRTHWFQ
jgi:hypothetical protein